MVLVPNGVAIHVIVTVPGPIFIDQPIAIGCNLGWTGLCWSSMDITSVLILVLVDLPSLLWTGV